MASLVTRTVVVGFTTVQFFFSMNLQVLRIGILTLVSSSTFLKQLSKGSVLCKRNFVIIHSQSTATVTGTFIIVQIFNISAAVSEDLVDSIKLPCFIILM